MKKILLSILFIVSLSSAFGQAISNRAGGATTVLDSSLFTGKAFRPPAFQDTTVANTKRTLDSAGKLLYTYDVDGFWMRQNNPRRWVRLASTNITNNSITNISVTNVTDSSVDISICVGDNVCDTTTISNVTIVNPAATQTVELLNDSTITICDSLANCDTAIINRQQFLYFFQNALTQISPGVVEFGGEMLHTTTVTFGGAEYVVFYTSGDFGLPPYPNTRNDGAQINVLATTSQGVVQSMPFVNTIRNGIIYGGIVTWSGTGYEYNISAAGYYLNGVFYTSNDTTITLSAADSTYDRIDVFVLNESGQVEVIEGTPAPVPSQPSVDPETQLGAISFALVTNNTTEPQNITSECIYTDNVSPDWTVSTFTARIDPSSTNTPCGGTKSVEATAVNSSDWVRFTRSAAFNPKDDYATLTFTIKSKGNWGNANQNRRLYIRWRNSSTFIVGNSVVLSNGSFGFNAANTTDCQTVSISMTSFGLPSNASVDVLEIAALTNNGTFGWFIDNICMQGGVPTAPPTVSGLSAVSVGNLTPLFNSSVDNSTSTATVTYTQQAAAENTFLVGNGTGYEFRAIQDTDVVDLHYYRYVAQLTDTSFIIFRGDGTSDTIEVTLGDGLSVYAANGLNMRNDSTVAWGDTLDMNTTIETAGFPITFTGANASPNNVLTVTTSGNSAALKANATSGNALFGVATTGIGGQFNTTSGAAAIQAFSTSTLAASLSNGPSSTTGNSTVVQIIRQSSGTPANDISGSIDMWVGTSTQPTGRLANQLISKWTTAADATRTSQFIISGVNSGTTGDILTLNGNKSIKANGYGSGTFTGTATYTLQVDASGNIIEGAAGISSITADNGLTASTATNVQLGGTLLQATTINSNAFQLIVSGTVSANSFQVTNFGSGGAISGTTLSATSPGVAGYSSNSTFGALYGQSSDGVVMYHNMTGGSTNSSNLISRYVKQSGSASANSGIHTTWDMSTTDATTLRTAMYEGVYWTVPTNTAEVSAYTLKLINAGLQVEALKLGGEGYMQLRPITATAASAITPAEGMILMVSSTDATFTSIGFWGYSSGSWAKF